MRLAPILLFLFPCGLFAYPPAEAEAMARLIVELTDDEVSKNLEQFDQSLVDYRNDERVFRRIVNYLQDWPISSGRVLARSVRFYPIFERELAAAGLPLALKHLSIVESALRPWAVSHAGAGGLWQLMPGTARELGLTVNEELDERLDAEVGCAAGLEYLRRQYERYEDWALAMAAYNSGPGNVNRAIRRSGKKDYWKLRRFLPRETRNYVPNFIAASYLMTFHQRHGVAASPLDLDLQLTDHLTVHRRLSLHRVAMITGLRPEIVVELNPQYLRGYLPGHPGGHRLQLPKRTIPALREYLARHAPQAPEATIPLPWADPLMRETELDSERCYAKYHSSVYAGDTTLRQVATHFGIPVDRLARWNEVGEMDSLEAHQQIAYWEVKEYLRYDRTPREVPEPLAPLLLLSLSPRRNGSETLALPVATVPATPPTKAGKSRLFGWLK